VKLRWTELAAAPAPALEYGVLPRTPEAWQKSAVGVKVVRHTRGLWKAVEK